MTSRIASPPELPDRIRQSWMKWLPFVLVAAVALAALVLVASHLVASSPPTVKRIVFANATEYDFDVQVTNGARDGVVDLVTAKAHSSNDAEDVVDQGQTWVFQFAAQGMRAGELEISRTDLVQAGWRVEIPDRIAQPLRDAGVGASPTTRGS